MRSRSGGQSARRADRCTRAPAHTRPRLCLARSHASPSAMSAQTIVMQAKGLVKRYGHVTALDGSDFELRAGEILAVIGDNGAGKSSLIKCLSGAIVPDEGELFLDGKPVHFRSPIEARRHG